MNNGTYLSDESRARAEEALAFHASEARKLYSSQRLPNDNDDLCVSLAAGLEKLKAHGSDIISALTKVDDTTEDV